MKRGALLIAARALRFTSAHALRVASIALALVADALDPYDHAARGVDQG